MLMDIMIIKHMITQMGLQRISGGLHNDVISQKIDLILRHELLYFIFFIITYDLK